MNSFPLPDEMEPALKGLRDYWLSLKRGGADMPFSDDVVPSKAAPDGDGVMLINAFENPERFRFEIVGARIVDRYGSPLNGKFTDETEDRPPLESLTRQCAATIAQRSPTYFRPEPSTGRGYARILLPTWGDGHIMMLLGAVAEL